MIIRGNRLALSFIAAFALLSTACSKDQLVGNSLRSYTIDHALPIILKTDDIPMICHANDGFNPVIRAFTQFNVETDMMLAFAYAGSSICNENQAIEKELWSSLAEKQGWFNAAIDARTAQQLLNKQAGDKQLKAYKHTLNYFQKQHKYDLGEGSCPQKLSEVEDLLLFVGATSALQALHNDVASGRLISIDMGIPPKVVRAMSCLNNEKWWGFPQSLQAALVVILPETPEMEAKGWETLQNTAKLGLNKGMRIGYATYAIVADIKGRDDYLRDALKRFESVESEKIDANYLLLDTLAEQQIRHIANRVWMRTEGHRAPTEGYSKFADETKAPNNSLDNLLDDNSSN